MFILISATYYEIVLVYEMDPRRAVLIKHVMQSFEIVADKIIHDSQPPLYDPSDCNELQSFWITWNDGKIRVSKTICPSSIVSPLNL